MHKPEGQRDRKREPSADTGLSVGTASHDLSQNQVRCSAREPPGTPEVTFVTCGGGACTCVHVLYL